MELDLDGENGCKLLRVLLHLVMHEYPPLVSRALTLLFQHFSQRQEVLNSFRQVNIYNILYLKLYKKRQLTLLPAPKIIQKKTVNTSPSARKCSRASARWTNYLKKRQLT